MAETRSMSAQDALWLTMDRPNNLMVIDGVMLLRGRPDWDDVIDVVRQRVVERFPVFRCRAMQGEGGWVWQPDPHFDISRHLRSVELPAPAGVDELEAYVAEQRSRPIDRDRPLWEVTLVESVTLDDGSAGSAIVARFHHAIADGVRMTQVMLSLCDTDDPSVSAMVGRSRGDHGVWSVATGIAGAAAEAVIDGARAFAQATS
ncbi:MAG: wax ester/triacylglycerol synthase domain-containing protein, partial [Actinomycetota bacterium]